MYFTAQGMYIYHQGGGWCQTVEECAQRAKTQLGSSKTYKPTMDLLTTQTHVFHERNTSTNPLMSDWTFVWMPYCDGGSWAGDSSAQVAAGEGEDAQLSELQFRGKRIRESVVASLTASAGFGSLTDLVIGGCSAGATAAYLHVDWYAAQAPPGATVRAMPDSGWFVEG